MLRWRIWLAVLAAALPMGLHADAAADKLFLAVAETRARAEAAQAALLAPESYASGIRALERAEADHARGLTAEKLQARIEEADGFFHQAVRNAGAAKTRFALALASREAAREAEAFRLAAAAFAAAERRLQDAAKRLERGDSPGAERRAEEARQGYRGAELEAIKAALLTEARAAVLAMESVNAARQAPKTAARARSLLEQADAALTRDRKRVEEPGRLAGDAVREAQHAVALAAILEQSRAQGATPEDLVREWETSLAEVATAAGARLEFSNGPRVASAALRDAVAGLRQRSEQLGGDITERQKQIASLEEEIRDLDTRLSGASSEARSLSLKLAAQERAREQFRQLEQVFMPGEASVLRESNRIVVRLQGLGFAPGSSSLSRKGTRLMDKVAQVVAIYPGEPLLVEGYTDSSGDSAANQRLSQARADAVRSYMMDTLKVPAGRVQAIGYGDARPIASNDTVEGRRQNRRIELVIAVKPDDAL
jgi:outer membrane protein OmpA-like peptidoglycan-associated protein